MYPYDNQISQMLLQGIQQNNPMINQDVIEVCGRSGAEAFQIGPNRKALLLDNTAPILWFVKTDGAGYKTLLPYDLKPHEEKPIEDKYKSLEDRITKLEETINAKQSNTTNARRKSDAAE